MNAKNTTYADGIEDFVAQCNAIMVGEYHKLPIPEQRMLYEKLAEHFNGAVPKDVHIDQCEFITNDISKRFRIYRKVGAQSDGFVFYIRGGGFVLGSLETHHVLMADICSTSGLTVVAADFRLAPEAQFPAAIDDCEDILRHTCENRSSLGLGVGPVIVSGDSSGGNMAVALCMRLRDKGDRAIHAQVLFNPVLNFARWENGGVDAPLLTAGEMEFYTACYAPGDMVFHEHVSPILDGDFTGLPPAYVMGAELDSLREDSVTYVTRLLANGVKAELMVEPGLVHGGVRARNMSKGARSAFDRACGQIQRFSKPPASFSKEA